jgi:hypothetical protein
MWQKNFFNKEIKNLKHQRFAYFLRKKCCVTKYSLFNLIFFIEGKNSRKKKSMLIVISWFM